MAKQNKFGTFGGVFVPSILTILGVIMYLRLPMIIGEAGLWATLGIILVAHIISVTTGLSVSSIATDKKVEAGGTYYMISRSLGLSIGGTLGLALFVGLSFSVSLYLIGFSESFLNYWEIDTNINNIRLTGSLVLLAVTTITFISTSLAMKTQYFIMAAIILSLLSIFFGDHEFTPATPLLSNPEATIPVMVLFGIFFPAVTGFEAGVSMSGDLKDPKKSIPMGSIAAVVVGFVVYIILATFLAYTVDGTQLAGNKEVLLGIAWIPELVVAGIWGATLSSALGSILGAPRILQATAIDKITPKFFSIGYGKTNEPRNALLLTFLIAESGILIGELDIIAGVVSIFFITTYGFLNISAAFEYWTSADFRPEFKVSGWVSVVGAVACIIVMILLNIVSMLASVLILGLLFLYLKRKELTLDSGDTWSSVWASLVRRGLTNLKKDKIHNRNWRPNTIMFSGSPEERKHLVEMGKAISGKLGILSAFELIESKERVLAKTVSNLTENKGSEGFFQHKLYCREIYEGMDEIARVYGFSGIEPNTIMMGWSRNPKNKEKFIGMLENFEYYRYNSIFLKFNPKRKFGAHKSIDIWWNGSGRNLVLGIFLIRYITNSNLWRSARVRLLVINPKKENEESVHKSIAAILDSYRVDFGIEVINNETDPKEDKEIIAAHSKETDLVLLGIPSKKFRQLDQYYDEISEKIAVVGSALVLNASENFEEIEVISNDKQSEFDESAKQAVLVLPELQLAKYPEIATDIKKIDINGQKSVELFYRKAFRPIFNGHVAVLNELRDRIAVIKKETEQIKTIPDNYRRKKAIDKLKNDLFFRVNNFIKEELINEALKKHEETLSEGLQWYEEKLQGDFRQFPSKMTIKFPKEDFKVKKTARPGLKNYKRYKLFIHWFIGAPVTHSINYREVARYFQLNNRRVFVSKLLLLFSEEESGFYSKVRNDINAIVHYLDETERKIWQEDDAWEDQSELLEIDKNISDQLLALKNLSELYLGRLKLEFRKNLQLMNNEMAKIDVDHIIKKKRRKPSYYEGLYSEMTQFPEDYSAKVMTSLNKILMELAINATKNRIETINEEYLAFMKRAVEQKYFKKLDTIISSLENNKDVSELQKIKLEDNLENSLSEAFGENQQKMLALTEEMPESMEIYGSSGEEDTLSIPIARMTEYFLKSKYENAVGSQLKSLLDILKRSMHTVKDLLNLAQFNLENTSETNASKKEQTESKKEILEDVANKINAEKENMDTKLEAFEIFASTQLQHTFDPLSSIKIEESATDFVSGLRTYQSKQVISIVKRFRSEFEQFFQQQITRLFYSRSRGILIAKKLNKDSGLASTNSHLLDLKEKVNINENVVQAIPPYYYTLFSNRSNINKDFWVPRSLEENAFNKAIKRYKSGFWGGILLLGERNVGKTAFCRYVQERHLKKQTTFSVFPTPQGMYQKSDFEEALRKATNKKGTARNILNRLPEGSILMIHDLELFWERTEQGMETVHFLKELMDSYSHKITFIINMNPYAYKLIDQLTDFGSHFIEVINFSPLNAEKLKELIMKRHQSSGLALRYEVDGPNLNQVQQAQLFNKYFDYSEGNPGTVLNGWLANIKKINSEALVVSKPEYPSLSGLKELNDDWSMLLAQFILHKRLDNEKINRISNWSPSKINSVILAMTRAGIIQERSTGVFQIDPCMHPFVVKSLKEREVLQ